MLVFVPSVGCDIRVTAQLCHSFKSLLYYWLEEGVGGGRHPDKKNLVSFSSAEAFKTKLHLSN